MPALGSHPHAVNQAINKTRDGIMAKIEKSNAESVINREMLRLLQIIASGPHGQLQRVYADALDDDPVLLADLGIEDL